MYMAQAERLVGVFVDTNMKYSSRSAIPKQPIAAIVVDSLRDTFASFQGRTLIIQRPRANNRRGPTPRGYFQQEPESELGWQVAVDFRSDSDFHECGSCPSRQCAT
jgi:hypothetical protein